MEINVENLDVLVVAIMVLFAGRFITGKLKFLQRFNIPPAVTGGIICSVLVAVLYGGWQIKINFDLQLRDLFLLFFFSTIGLGAKLSSLAAGGKTLAILTVVAAVLLILQNQLNTQVREQ